MRPRSRWCGVWDLRGLHGSNCRFGYWWCWRWLRGLFISLIGCWTLAVAWEWIQMRGLLALRRSYFVPGIIFIGNIGISLRRSPSWLPVWRLGWFGVPCRLRRVRAIRCWRLLRWLTLLRSIAPGGFRLAGCDCPRSCWWEFCLRWPAQCPCGPGCRRAAWLWWRRFSSIRRWRG